MGSARLGVIRIALVSGKISICSFAVLALAFLCMFGGLRVLGGNAVLISTSTSSAIMVPRSYVVCAFIGGSSSPAVSVAARPSATVAPSV